MGVFLGPENGTRLSRKELHNRAAFCTGRSAYNASPTRRKSPAPFSSSKLPSDGALLLHLANSGWSRKPRKGSGTSNPGGRETIRLVEKKSWIGRRPGAIVVGAFLVLPDAVVSEQIQDGC